MEAKISVCSPPLITFLELKTLPVPVIQEVEVKTVLDLLETPILT